MSRQRRGRRCPSILKFGNIKGDVKEKAHRGWIELISIQFGAPPGSGPGTGKEQFADIAITKKVDNPSAALFQQIQSGQGVLAVIDCLQEGKPRVYLRLKLSDTLISNWVASGHGANSTETLWLNFKKLEQEHNPGTPPP